MPSSILSPAGLLCLILRLTFLPQTPLELPANPENIPVYTYTGHRLQYNEDTEQPVWVAYEITAEEATTKLAPRASRFQTDPGIPTGSAVDQDYRKSGYDRGHLAPSADMRFSAEAMHDCFYFSNISPQRPDFNRGIWAQLESLVRSWAVETGSLYVVTGPIYNPESDIRIGINEVRVPSAFFKILLHYRGPGRPGSKAIAFILPNEGFDRDILSFAVSIDEAERITNLDFFPGLPDPEEWILERSFTVELWPTRDHP